MIFWVTNIVLLSIIVLLLILLSWVWPPDSPWSPWWRTNKKIARAMCRLAKVGKGDVVCDLGCGTGTAIITAAKEFGAKGVGIEIDPLRFIVSTLMIYIIKVQDKVKIIKNNFFDVDISSATVVFVYLVPKALERLKPKLLKELQKGVRIVSYRYEMNLPLKKHDKENDIRIYVI